MNLPVPIWGYAKLALSVIEKSAEIGLIIELTD